MFPAFSPPRFGPFPSFFPLREEMRETFFRPFLQPYPVALRKFAWPLWWRNGAGAVQAVRRRQSHGGVGISSRRANQKNRSPTGSAGRGTMRRAHTATTVMSWWRPEILIAPASFSWEEKVRETDLSSKKIQVFLNFSAVYENRKKHSQSVHKKNII